jgi:hypothetical protein
MIVGLPPTAAAPSWPGVDRQVVEEAVLLGALAVIVVRTICWILRERSRRRTLVDLERERRITLAVLADIQPERIEHLRGQLDLVRPPPTTTPPNELEPPPPPDPGLNTR